MEEEKERLEKVKVSIRKKYLQPRRQIEEWACSHCGAINPIKDNDKWKGYKCSNCGAPKK